MMSAEKMSVPGPVLMDHQKASLQEFRERLGASNSKYDDGMLLRFLVARSMNVDKAAEMLQKYLVWASTNKLDSMPIPGLNGNSVLYPVRGYKTIADANPDPLRKNFPQEYVNFTRFMGGASYHYVDKEGRPVFIDRLGLYDTKKWANAINAEQWLDFHIRSNEMLYRTLMEECTTTSGTFTDKNTVIFDCSGMGFHQFHWPALNLLKLITEVDQAYYPERLGMLFIVNAPALFTRVWSIVKKWLDERMLGKIHILGSDFRTTLLEYIDADKLPKFLGGNCTCSHIKGGCCPSPFVDDNNPDKKVATVREGEYPYVADLEVEPQPLPHSFEVDIPKPDESIDVDGSNSKQILLKWRFKSTEPVKFEILFKGESGESSSFLAVTDHSPGPVLNQAIITQPGTYYLQWTAAPVPEAKVEKASSGFFGWASSALGFSGAAGHQVEYNVELEMVDA